MIDLNCPNILACIDQVIADPCGTGTGTMADEARDELAQLLANIKASNIKITQLEAMRAVLKSENKRLCETIGRLDRRLAMHNDEPGVGGPFI